MYPELTWKKNHRLIVLRGKMPFKRTPLREGRGGSLASQSLENSTVQFLNVPNSGPVLCMKTIKTSSKNCLVVNGECNRSVKKKEKTFDTLVRRVFMALSESEEGGPL